jgi:hypothetical protein
LELTEWRLLFEIHAEEADLREQGLSEDEISDAIESRGERVVEHATGGLVDQLLSDEDRAERQQQLIELELQDIDEDDDDDDG